MGLTKQTDAGNGPRTPLRKKRLTTTQKAYHHFEPKQHTGYAGRQTIFTELPLVYRGHIRLTA
jgi:hypothetical protein